MINQQALCVENVPVVGILPISALFGLVIRASAGQNLRADARASASGICIRRFDCGADALQLLHTGNMHAMADCEADLSHSPVGDISSFDIRTNLGKITM